MPSLHARCFAIIRSSELGCLAVLSPVRLVWGLGGSLRPPPASLGDRSPLLTTGRQDPGALPLPHLGKRILGDKQKTQGSILSLFPTGQQGRARLVGREGDISPQLHLLAAGDGCH